MELVGWRSKRAGVVWWGGIAMALGGMVMITRRDLRCCTGLHFLYENSLEIKDGERCLLNRL